MAGVAAQHRWKFVRVGGLDQVVLETADDLRMLAELDQKLWVALSCPTKGLELDARTLALLDLDRDGHVRMPELHAAIRFCDLRLRDLSELVPGKEALALASINDATPEGKAALGAARHILRSLNKPEAAAIVPADVLDTTNVFANTAFNGDGIVHPEAADEPDTRKLLDDAIACLGGLPDRSGKVGIDEAKLDLFFADLAAFADWMKKGEAEGVQPLGAATAAAFESLQAVREKIDDFFVRCRMVAFDSRALPLMNGAEAELTAIANKPLATPGADVAALPLAHVQAQGALPLVEGTNPAWSAKLLALQQALVAPRKNELNEADWRAIKERFALHEAWLAAKAGASVEKLGLPRALELLAGGGKAAVSALLVKDKALESEAAAIADVVRLVLYLRDLHTLLRNFVSFADFYDFRRWAVFQAGTLYLDSRSCELCVRVEDPSAHALLGSLSRLYIAYCDLKRPNGESMKVAACFTQGDSDYLMVGRNGVFYDRQGRDWDATITKIVDNPISVRQAFFSPYKKALRMIEEQVARFAAAKEKESDARMAATAQTTGQAATGAKAQAAAAAVDVGKMVGIIAALGVGVGALGALFGGLMSGFLNLQPWWAKLLAVLGVVLIISGPSMLIAWLKLRQRTLGPVLDANGWAVNGRVKVNIPLGTALTDIKSLPPNSTRSLNDPFEDKEARRRKVALWVVAALLLIAAALARYHLSWPFK